MDLSTISNNIKAGKYESHEQFAEDMRLIEINCTMYNGPAHSITKSAKEFRQVSIAEISRCKDHINSGSY